MNANSIKFRKHPCFKNSWAGFDEILPVNLIIGRNNTGKSRLLELIQALCENTIKDQPWEIAFGTVFEKAALFNAFNPNTNDFELRGNQWSHHGKYFADAKATVWMQQGVVTEVVFENRDHLAVGLEVNYLTSAQSEIRKRKLIETLNGVLLPLKGRAFRRLMAERNIGMEKSGSGDSLGPDGHGATDIIRRHLTSSSASRDLIRHDLLHALNEIFGADGQFTEIVVNQHDRPQAGQSQDHWEVYQGEEKKGLVALSRSGSGLKTILLVLLNLIVMPTIERHDISHYVFAFEELETHLHPTLLRRLLLFIEKFSVEKKALVFLTTHSSVALDLFGLSKYAQIVHVQHDKESASATTVKAHFDRVGIVAELGVKPSDLLNANGIIWVEGPSDRVYVNRWLDLASGGEIKEGRDYTCAMYGGALLARSQLVAPDQVDAELTNLLSINSNFILLCDSDRTAAKGVGSQLKERVARIAKEVAAVPGGVCWVTSAKEIENYLPAEALEKAFPDIAPRAPNQFERFFPSAKGFSFLKNVLGRTTIDKVDLATVTAPHLTVKNMEERFDWKTEIDRMVSTIRRWNH